MRERAKQRERSVLMQAVTPMRLKHCRMKHTLQHGRSNWYWTHLAARLRLTDARWGPDRESKCVRAAAGQRPMLLRHCCHIAGPKCRTALSRALLRQRRENAGLQRAASHGQMPRQSEHSQVRATVCELSSAVRCDALRASSPSCPCCPLPADTQNAQGEGAHHARAPPVPLRCRNLPLKCQGTSETL